jgi:hypothetical protein
MADKLSSLEAHLSHLEDKAKIVKVLEIDMKKSHQRILVDNKELMKQNELLDREVSELREEVHLQTATLLEIYDMLQDLKIGDSS